MLIPKMYVALWVKEFHIYSIPLKYWLYVNMSIWWPQKDVDNLIRSIPN